MTTASDIPGPAEPTSLEPDREPAPNGWPWSLLRGFRDGESGALREVYRMHADDVARHLRLGFSFEARGASHRFAGIARAFDLHDALHETFRRAFEPDARQRYDGLRPYGPYLKAIARNVVLRSFRNREDPVAPVGESGAGAVFERPVDGGPEVPTPESAVAREEVRRVVQSFLATLSEDERAFVEVRFVGGASQRDAAERLGLGRQQVRGRELKLRSKLLAFLLERGEAGLLPSMPVASWLALVGAELGTQGLAEVLR